MQLDQFTYVFAIGTFFALLDAFNNGASKSASPAILTGVSQDSRFRECCDRRANPSFARDHALNVDGNRLIFCSQTMSLTRGPHLCRRGPSRTGKRWSSAPSSRCLEPSP